VRGDRARRGRSTRRWCATMAMGAATRPWFGGGGSPLRQPRLGSFCSHPSSPLQAPPAPRHPPLTRPPKSAVRSPPHERFRVGQRSVQNGDGPGLPPVAQRHADVPGKPRPPRPPDRRASAEGLPGFGVQGHLQKGDQRRGVGARMRWTRVRFMCAERPTSRPRGARSVSSPARRSSGARSNVRTRLRLRLHPHRHLPRPPRRIPRLPRRLREPQRKGTRFLGGVAAQPFR